MKMGYYAYYLSKNDNKKYLFDLKSLLSSYIKYASDGLRKSITTEFKEKLFLFYVLDDIYMLVITKDSEIIKAINENKLEHADIYSKLSNNESLGFTSYVYIQEEFFGIGATYFGPKISKFVFFMNELLKILSLKKIEFKVQPFGTEATKEEIMSMPYVGKTIIQIGPGNTFFQRIKEFVGTSDIQDETNSFIITIKPNRGKDIKDTFQAFANNIGDEDLQKFIVKAKEELSDAATDYYIVGRGAVSDIIPTKDEKQIPNEILKRCNRNKYLAEKVKEFQGRDDVVEDNQAANKLRSYNESSAWTAINNNFLEL